MHEIVAIADKAAPMIEQTSPPVSIPPTNPSFFEPSAKNIPTIPAAKPRNGTYEKTMAAIPSTSAAIALPLPGGLGGGTGVNPPPPGGGGGGVKPPPVGGCGGGVKPASPDGGGGVNPVSLTGGGVGSLGCCESPGGL